MKTNNSEGLKFARSMMVLSSLTPLFVLWAIRGVSCLSNGWFLGGCIALIILPNLILVIRWRVAIRSGDQKVLIIGKAEDHRDHLIVYLFTMLIPLYQANMDKLRDFSAVLVAFLFIVFLFWHLNLHYMNVIFAILGYKVFSITPPDDATNISNQEPYVLLSRRSFLKSGTQLTAFRISNTVFIEMEG